MRAVIYFDHNATSPLLPEARQAWLETCEQYPGNPSSPHRLGARADNALNEAREKLAAILGCHAAQMMFTSGATESNNTVLHHYARTLSRDSEVWISAIEHPCMLEPARFYFGERLRLMPATPEGVVERSWIERELKRARPALVVLMAANNETGALQPWQEVAALCREREVPFVCDAVQWMGKLPAAGLAACDWVSGSAHKFGGPRGVGFLKVPDSLTTVPLLRGGPQEETRRAGTENVPGVVAMIAALNTREKQIAGSLIATARERRDDFERKLARVLPGVEIIAQRLPRLWNTVAALMPEADCQQRWVVKLDKLGFAVSTGSACASGKEEPSHVLRAMGYTPAHAARMLRFSGGLETSGKNWDALLSALKSIQGQLIAAEKKLAGTARVE